MDVGGWVWMLGVGRWARVLGIGHGWGMGVNSFSLMAGASVAGRWDSITWCQRGKTVTEERNGGGRTDSRKAEWECSTNGIADTGGRGGFTQWVN